MTAAQDTIPTPPTPAITALIAAKWAAAQDDGNAPALTLADYLALIDAGIDADTALDLARDEFGDLAVFTAAPWLCPICGGAKTVSASEREYIDRLGMLAVYTDPCPLCVADAGQVAA